MGTSRSCKAAPRLVSAPIQIMSQDDRGRERGAAHRGAHRAFGIVVVDSEGGYAAFEFSAWQAAQSGNSNGFVGFETQDADVGTLSPRICFEYFLT